MHHDLVCSREKVFCCSAAKGSGCRYRMNTLWACVGIYRAWFWLLSATLFTCDVEETCLCSNLPIILQASVWTKHTHSSLFTHPHPANHPLTDKRRVKQWHATNTTMACQRTRVNQRHAPLHTTFHPLARLHPGCVYRSVTALSSSPEMETSWENSFKSVWRLFTLDRIATLKCPTCSGETFTKNVFKEKKNLTWKFHERNEKSWLKYISKKLDKAGGDHLKARFYL